MSDERAAGSAKARETRPHRQLVLWQRAVDLVTAIYEAPQRFPAVERFGLVGQMRRAAVSIPSNVAEGAARKSRGEYQQFLYVARGSLSELDTQVEIARRLGYLTPPAATGLQQRIEETSRLLSGLLGYVSSKRGE